MSLNSYSNFTRDNHVIEVDITQLKTQFSLCLNPFISCLLLDYPNRNVDIRILVTLDTNIRYQESISRNLLIGAELFKRGAFEKRRPNRLIYTSPVKTL